MTTKKEDVRRVALYARVSTDDQDAGSQLGRLREWALAAGFAVTAEGVDVASGRLARRPEFDRLLSLARGHHIHALAVAKVDRAARSVQHLAGVVAELHRLGVDFHAIDQGLTVARSDPTSKLILSVLAAVAEWEADIISERTRDALAAKKAAGVRLGRPLADCAECGAARDEDLRGKRGGRRVPLCAGCKSAGAARGRAGGVA